MYTSGHNFNFLFLLIKYCILLYLLTFYHRALYFISKEATFFRKVFRMSKPNTVFNLGLRDIDLIEDAVNSVIARRSATMNMLVESTIKNTNDMPVYQEIRKEVAELRDLLGRLHNQKTWYRPTDTAVYVSG